MIVFSADLHLRPTTWAKFPDLRDDSFYSFRQMTEFCCKEKVDALILGGDVFDSPTPDSESVITFKTGMEILEANSIPVYGIQGQHERSDPPWMALNPNVKYLDDPQMREFRTWSIQCDGQTLKVRGMDNTSAARLKGRLDADQHEEPYDILVLHQALQGMVYESAWNLSDEWIPSFVHIVLLGDLHIEANKGRCYYSGSMSLQNIGESPQKSFITIKCDELKNLTVERQTLETRDMFKFTITDEDSRDAAIDILKEYKPNKRNSLILRPLVVAYISPDVPSAHAYLEAVCETSEMFLDIRDLRLTENTMISPSAPVEMVSMEDLVEESVEPMQFDTPEDKEELADFAVRLLRAKDANSELLAIKQEMGVTTGTG